MKEIFKPITGYEGIYEVSNLGNVRNSRTGKVLVGRRCKSTCNYTSLTVRLYKDFASKNKAIHRLVAVAFISNPKDKPEVNHIDNNPQNNNVNNLEWVTHRENSLHCSNSGRKINRFRKLTNEQILFIRGSELKNNELKKMFNVSQPTISNIKRFITYKILI